jgi:phage replication-related protein YjqB (UPF0714/DUF867 family)
MAAGRGDETSAAADGDGDGEERANGTVRGFAELLARDDVFESVRLRSAFGFMAFHGGLEAHTECIARNAADMAGASVYTVVQPAALGWHVPSHVVTADVSQPLARFLEHVDVAIAVHGYGRRDRRGQVLLGGSNRELAAMLGAALADALPGIHVVTDLEHIPAELRGLHHGNPVNRPAGGGVQMELPPRVRTDELLVDTLAKVAMEWHCTR